MPAKGQHIDMTGQRVGRLRVVGFAGKGSRRSTLWRCVCDCGNEAIVPVGHLRKEHTRSCGCLQRETASECQTTHGLSKRPEYRVWQTMLRRCANASQRGYEWYGGRGIKVCDRWHDFENFWRDMGPRPSDSHSIERKNSDEDYSPENCVWVAAKHQSRNTRANRVVEFDGQRKCLAEWAELTGLSAALIRDRLKYGWDAARALTTPRKPRKGDAIRGRSTHMYPPFTWIV